MKIGLLGQRWTREKHIARTAGLGLWGSSRQRGRDHYTVFLPLPALPFTFLKIFRRDYIVVYFILEGILIKKRTGSSVSRCLILISIYIGNFFVVVTIVNSLPVSGEIY